MSEAPDKRSEIDLAAILERMATAVDDHYRDLIVERLGWTPQERFDANVAIVRCYQSVREEIRKRKALS